MHRTKLEERWHNVWVEQLAKLELLSSCLNCEESTVVPDEVLPWRFETASPKQAQNVWLLCGTGQTCCVKGDLQNCNNSSPSRPREDKYIPKGWGWKGKQKIYLFGCRNEVDCCVIAIILLRKAEGELIVNEQSICKESMEKVTPCLGIKQSSAKRGTMLLRAQRAVTNYSNLRMIPHKRNAFPSLSCA